MKGNYNKFEGMVVCCATCGNKICKMNSSYNKECLDVTSTMNSILYWSEETGYLRKLNSIYPYIHWKRRNINFNIEDLKYVKKEFIKKGEMWIE